MENKNKSWKKFLGWLEDWLLTTLVIVAAGFTVTLFIWTCNDGCVDWDVFWTVTEIIAIIGFFI